MKESSSPAPVLATDALWQQWIQALRSRFLPYIIDSWISNIHPVSFQNDVLTLQAPDSFTKEWIGKHYVKDMLQALQEITTPKTRIEWTLGNAAQPAAKPAGRQTASAPAPESDSRFNSRYIFKNFIIGSSNQFAHAACMAVANSPSKAYNPLFLYGPSGLGKTHLLHAIGQHALSKNKKTNVIYLSTEEFTNQLIDAIKNKNTLKFRNKYRKIDILLIDDIHFLSGKEQTQEEFFHTFNTLYADHKQVVLTSDRSPKELKNIEDRLVSRFESGLIADLQPPDTETRIAIIRNKAESSGISLENDIAVFIATHIKHNIRKIEGALIRLISYSSLTGTPITLSMAQEILKDIIATEKEVEITMDLIQKRVAEHFDIRLGDLKSDKRQKSISGPRQLAMFLARELTRASLKDIGEAFGGKDHTTVIHALKKMEKLIHTDEPLKKTVNQIRLALKTRE